MYNGQRQLRKDLLGRWAGNRSSELVGDAHDDNLPPRLLAPTRLVKTASLQR